MKERICLLIPTRNRPRAIESIVKEYETYGAGLVDIVIGVDDDDDFLPEYQEIVSRYDILSIFIGPRKRLGPTLNDMAVKYAEEYFALGFIGDDMRPRTKDWDRIMLEELKKLVSGFSHGDDGHWGDQLATQVFLTSDIVRSLGYMVPPGMVHLFLDNFWSDFARAIDKFSYRGDVLIEHLHPAWGKADMDASYQETNSAERMNGDRVLYERYCNEQFQKDKEKVLKIL